MIKGIGNDIVDMDRVRHIVTSKYGERFVKRVLTDQELARLSERPHRRAEFVAGRFAAKEAVSKALGCGIGKQMGFHDMEIIPNQQGRPECSLSARSRLSLGLASTERIHVTITHSHTAAVAFAVWESID